MRQNNKKKETYTQKANKKKDQTSLQQSIVVIQVRVDENISFKVFNCT